MELNSHVIESSWVCKRQVSYVMIQDHVCVVQATVHREGEEDPYQTDEQIASIENICKAGRDDYIQEPPLELKVDKHRTLEVSVCLIVKDRLNTYLRCPQYSNKYYNLEPLVFVSNPYAAIKQAGKDWQDTLSLMYSYRGRLIDYNTKNCLPHCVIFSGYSGNQIDSSQYDIDHAFLKLKERTDITWLNEGSDSEAVAALYPLTTGKDTQSRHLSFCINLNQEDWAEVQHEANLMQNRLLEDAIISRVLKLEKVAPAKKRKPRGVPVFKIAKEET